MERFFAAGETNGLHASLAFFPEGETDQSSSSGCQDQTYSGLFPTMQALPDANTFRTQISGASLHGDTPTLPALRGTIEYAKRVGTDLKGKGKVAIVLVTDGVPAECSSTDENVAAEAAKVASDIPTMRFPRKRSLEM